jgi:hypothetical protein
VDEPDENRDGAPEPGDERVVREEEAAAAREAGRIGGRSGMEDMDPAERASAEHGGGEAEGFEQAEERLIETATHGDGRRVDPVKDASEPEEAATQAEYGEGDSIRSTETDDDTQGTPGDLDGSADEPDDRGNRPD